MSVLVIIVIAAAAIALGLFLAYLPMRLLMNRMARGIVEPIRAFIARQRERRTVERQSSDRRKSA